MYLSTEGTFLSCLLFQVYPPRGFAFTLTRALGMALLFHPWIKCYFLPLLLSLSVSSVSATNHHSSDPDLFHFRTVCGACRDQEVYEILMISTETGTQVTKVGCHGTQQIEDYAGLLVRGDEAFVGYNDRDTSVLVRTTYIRQ